MTEPQRTPWPRDAFRAAVCSSDCPLTGVQRHVALCFAEHARDQDCAFVAYQRLVDWTGWSRTAVAKAIAVLVESGWLVEKEPGRQHYAPRYWLKIPVQQGSVSRTSDASQQYASHTPEPPSSTPRDTSSTPRDTSSTPRVPDHQPHHQPDRADDDVREAAPLAPEHAEAIGSLLAKWPGLTEADAAGCVAVVASRAKSSLVGYVGRFQLEDIRANAHRYRAKTGTPAATPASPVPALCEHGERPGPRAADGTSNCYRCDTAAEQVTSGAQRCQAVS